VREIILYDLDAQQRMGLHLLQNIQAAPPALTAGNCQRIGHNLRSRKTNSGTSSVPSRIRFPPHRQCAVNNGAGVQNLEVRLLPAARSPANSSPASGKVQ